MDIDKLILEVYICVLLWNQVNPNATTFELVSENKFSLIQTMYILYIADWLDKRRLCIFVAILQTHALAA